MQYNYDTQSVKNRASLKIDAIVRSTGRRGRYHMVLDIQLPMQSVPITGNVVRSNPAHGEVCLIQHYLIKITNDLQQVGAFSPGTPVSPINKTDHHSYSNTMSNYILMQEQTYIFGLTK